MAINHAFFSPFKHFLFGRGVTDQKIRHLSGEFRRSFGPWGAGNLNEPIFKSSKDGGGGGGWVGVAQRVGFWSFEMIDT